MPTIAKMVGDAHRREMTNALVNGFTAFCKTFMIRDPQQRTAALARKTPLVKSLVENRMELESHFSKAAVAPLSTTNTSAVGDFTEASTAFLESIGAFGAFDAMVSAMRPVPMMADVIAVTAAGNAAVVGETQLKKIGRLSMASTRLQPIKVIALLVWSNELARFSGARGNALFRTELQKATANVTDQQFITELTASITPTASAGTTMDAVRSDLRQLMQEVDSDQNSKFFLLMSSSTAKNLALVDTADPIMRDFTVLGGSIAGITCLITDAASNNLILVDANQIAADRGLALPGQSTQALIQMQDAPDSPVAASTISISLFQQNMQALKLERWFAIERLRTASVAVISNVSYGGANSPA